ncbi:MAG TPA: hypothetical protein VLL76_00490 [Candidatus Omnitrophota bacterium]|nr:hypothetical protein [Candidatus Omnitrophota bacterium]
MKLARILMVAALTCSALPALAQTKALQGPAVAGGMAAGPGLAAGDRLAMAQDWLKTNPDDAHTLRFAAQQLLALERYAEAADLFARADGLDPGGADSVGRAAALIRLGRMEEAREVAEAPSLAIPGERGRLAALRGVAKALVAAGEMGRARAVLDAAIAQSPREAGLLVERAALDAAAGRPLRAIPALERAVQLAPHDSTPQRTLVRAWLDAGQFKHAHAAAEAARKGSLALDEQIVVADLAALQGLGEQAKAVALGEDYLKQRPRSAPVMRALATSHAALGGKDRAADLLRQALRMAPPDDAAIALLRQIIPEPERGGLLTDLRRRYPAIPALWRDDVDPPGDLAWPWREEAARLAAEGKPAAARTQLTRALAAIPERMSGQRALVLLHLAELTDEPTQALSHLAAAEKLNVPLGEVLSRRAQILLRAGWWDEASAALWAWAGLRPDDADAVAALFRPEMADRLGWARAFAQLHDHVQRDPDSPDRRLMALEAHAGTGGSPLLALAHADALAKLVPAGDPRAAQGRLLRDRVTLGLDALGNLVEANAAEGRMVIDTAEDGRIVATFHPVTGRLVRFDRQGRWIAATWSPDGLDLERIADSDGNSLTLARKDGGIQAIEAKGAVNFKAEIGKDGSPVITTRGDSGAAVEAYNAALALLTSWPRTGLAGARWLKVF